MPEPDEVRFACIGCGAMNPAGSPVCSGCGHVFAGPDSGLIPTSRPTPGSATPLHEPRSSYLPTRSRREPTVLGCLARLIGITATMGLAVYAFGVAFFMTCVALSSNEMAMVWSMLAGLAAAGAVVGFALWIWSLWRQDWNPIEYRQRKKR